MLPQTESYVYVNDKTNEIQGFIGLIDNYIAGIFVSAAVQSCGIRKQLLNYAKENKSHMSLSVYQKNTRAVQFYQREAFKIQSEKVDENTGEKEFIMTWIR